MTNATAIRALREQVEAGEPISRDEVRSAYSGDVPDWDAAYRLREEINRQMLAAALMEGTYHMRHSSYMRVSKTCAELRCQAYYFDDREAVTFHSDGFTGFAGWADDTNVQPILRGFVFWADAEARALEAKADDDTRTEGESE